MPVPAVSNLPTFDPIFQEQRAPSEVHEDAAPGMKTELEEIGDAANDEYLQRFTKSRDSTFFLAQALYTGIIRAATASWSHPEKTLTERLEWAETIRQAAGADKDMHEQALRSAMKQNGKLLNQMSAIYEATRCGEGRVSAGDFPKETGFKLHRHRELSELRAIIERLQALPEYSGVLQVEVVSAVVEPPVQVSNKRFNCISRPGQKPQVVYDNPYVVAWLSGNGPGATNCQVQFSDVLIGVSGRAEWTQELPPMEIINSEAALHFEVRNSVDAATTDRHARAVQTSSSLNGALSPDKLMGQSGVLIRDLEVFREGAEMDLRLYRGMPTRSPVPEYIEDIAGAQHGQRILYDLTNYSVHGTDSDPVGAITIKVKYTSESRGDLALLMDAARSSIKRPTAGSVGWLRPAGAAQTRAPLARRQDWVLLCKTMDLEPLPLPSTKDKNGRTNGKSKSRKQRRGSKHSNGSSGENPIGPDSWALKQELTFRLEDMVGIPDGPADLQVELRDMHRVDPDGLEQYDAGQLFLRVAYLVWRMTQAKAFEKLPNMGLSCYKVLQEYQGLDEFVESRLFKGLVPPSQLMELLLEFGRLQRVRPETQRLAILQMILENWQSNTAYLRAVESAAQPLLKSYKDGLLTMPEIKWLKGLTGLVIEHCTPLLDEHYSRLPIAEARKLLPKLVDVLQQMLVWKAEGPAAVELILPHFQRAAALRLQGHLEGQETGAVSVDMLLATINTAIEDFETDKILQTVLPSQYDFLRETSEMRYIVLEACMHMLFANESHDTIPMLGVVEQRLAVHHEQLLAAGFGSLVDAKQLLNQNVFDADVEHRSLQLYDLSSLVQQRLENWVGSGMADLSSLLQRQLTKEDWRGVHGKIPVAVAAVEMYRTIQGSFPAWCEHCLASCGKERGQSLHTTLSGGLRQVAVKLLKSMETVFQEELENTGTFTARTMLRELAPPCGAADSRPPLPPAPKPLKPSKPDELGVTQPMCVVLNTLRRMLMEQADLDNALDDVINSSTGPSASDAAGSPPQWESALVRDFDGQKRTDTAPLPRVVVDQASRRFYLPGSKGLLALQKKSGNVLDVSDTERALVEDVARAGMLMLAQYESCMKERLLLHFEALLNDVATQTARVKMEKLMPDKRSQIAISKGLLELVERTKQAVLGGLEMDSSKADVLEATWLALVDTLQRLAINQAKYRPINAEEAEILLGLLEDLYAALCPSEDLPLDYDLWGVSYSYCGCVLRLCSSESHVMIDLFESYRQPGEAGQEEVLQPLDGFEALTGPWPARAQRNKIAASWETGAGMRQVSLLDLLRLMRVRMKTERELKKFVETKLQQASVTASVLQVLYGLPSREPLICTVKCQLVGLHKAGSLHLAPPCLGFTTMLDADFMNNTDTTIRMLLTEVTQIKVETNGVDVLLISTMDGTDYRFHAFDGGKLSYLLRNILEMLQAQPKPKAELLQQVAELQESCPEQQTEDPSGVLRSAPCVMSAVLRNKPGVMHIYPDKLVYAGHSGEFWEAQMRHVEEVQQEKGPATSWLTIRQGAAQRWRAQRFGFDDSLTAQRMVETIRSLIRTFKP